MHVFGFSSRRITPMIQFYSSVCVYHLNRCKTSTSPRGMAAVSLARPASLWDSGVWMMHTPAPAYLYLYLYLYLYIYIHMYISYKYSHTRPWAHLSRSWRGHMVNGLCLILSWSPVIIKWYMQKGTPWECSFSLHSATIDNFCLVFLQWLNKTKIQKPKNKKKQETKTKKQKNTEKNKKNTNDKT